MDSNKEFIESLGYRFIEVPQFCDERGVLCFAENKHLPFIPKRVFWIYGVGMDKTRGGHAHNTCAEIIFPVKGSFDIFVDDNDNSETFTMNNPNKGIFIAPSVWCNLSNFSPDAVCLVLASHEYNAEGYINNYKEFKQMHNGTEKILN